MKAMYKKPNVDVMSVGACGLMQQISGGDVGFKGEKKADESVVPKAPGKRPF